MEIGEASMTESKTSGWERQVKLGDQTGKEVHTRSWYNFGQTIIFRFKNRTLAKKFAAFIEAACNNPLIGYDQSKRTTLHTALKKVGYDLSKLTTPCACDCSSLVATGLNAIGITVPIFRTATMEKSLAINSNFEVITKQSIVKCSDKLMVGDIINAPSKHVIVSLEDSEITTYPSKSKESTKVEAARYKNPTFAKKLTTKVATNFRYGAGVDKLVRQVLSKGTTVTCYGFYNMVNGSIWYYVAFGDQTGYVSSTCVS